MQWIHMDFINDDDLACTQTRNNDEELIKTLSNTIDSLTLDKRIAENDLLKMKQVGDRINWKSNAHSSEILNNNQIDAKIGPSQKFSKFKSSYTNPLINNNS